MLQNYFLESVRKGRSTLFDITKSLKASFQSISEAKYDNEHISKYLSKESQLDPSEKELIKQKYGIVIPKISRGYDFFHAMKAIDGFDVNYLPSSFYYPYFLRVLNPERSKKLLCNKSLLKFIYQAPVRQPVTPIRSLAGAYFDDSNRLVTPTQAKKIILDLDEPLLFKPSTDANCGAGIKLFTRDEIPELGESLKNRSLIRLGQPDFVLQIPVKQSEDTSIFNPSSLNCMRITTLNLNGIVTTNSMTLKCGSPNSVVDNIGSGRRGVMIGISENGSLSEFGYYGNGEKCTEHNGVKFKGRKITAFRKVIEAALLLHSMIESCRVIGWDIALDDSNNPVLIEGNTNYPGISLEQMCSGPIFAERIDEVISYITENQNIIYGGR